MLPPLRLPPLLRLVMRNSCGTLGIRRCAARRFVGALWLQRCCWRFPWFWDVLMTDGRLLCVILVRIVGFHFLTGDLMAKLWSAGIMAGNLRLAPDAASRFR